MTFLGPIYPSLPYSERRRKQALRSGFFFLLSCLFFFAGASIATAQGLTAFPGTTNVGSTSTAMSVTVTLSVSGAANAPTTTTQGAAKSDFAVVPGGTCAATSYTAGAQCTVNVTFSPLYPGMRNGAVLITNASGQVLGKALINGKAKGSLAVLKPGMINTIAGSGYWIYGGDGIPAVDAPIFLPMGVAEDAAGNVYLSDSSNNRVRRVDAKTGLISTVAGYGTPGYNGDGIAATSAFVSSPAAIVLDGADDIFFVDSGNHCIRRVDASTGLISTVAGVCGVEGFSGDGAAATAAHLSQPEGLAIDPAGNLYIADTGNNRVRKVDASTGFISTIAGTGVGAYNGDNIQGTSAQLNSPWGLALGLDGSLYIADLSNALIRKLSTTGIITTVAGNGNRGYDNDNVAATSAMLNAPAAVALDPAGNLYIGDAGNNRIRMVTASTGIITTLSGSSSQQFIGDGGTADKATLYGPYALYFDQSGNLLIADMFHNRVRAISTSSVSFSYAAIRVSKVSAPQAEELDSDGNADLNVSALALVNAALDPATTTCATGVLTSGLTCNLGVEFAPTTVGDTIYGTVTINSDAANTPSLINLSGQVLTVNPTSVALSSSNNPSLVGASVTFTAAITSTDTSLGGTVDFLDGNAVICKAVAVSGISATCTTSALTLGQHSITASYTGDADNASSVSPALIQIVKQQPTVALSVTPNPAVVTGTIALTATVTAPTGTATGTVTFYDAGVAIGTANVNTSGVATFSTTQLTAGTHSLIATYSGDATNATANSAAVSEVVSLATTATTLSTSNSSVTVGTSITLTSTVSSLNGPTPTGKVQFTEGATILGTGTITGGLATFTTSTLAPGTHILIAKYLGDNDNATSSSASLSQIVQQIGTTTLLSSDVNPANAGAVVTLSATVSMNTGSVADGAITGTVTFKEGSTTLGQSSIDTNGHATLPISTLSVGSHIITAIYSGNTNYATSTSSNLTQTITQTASNTALSVSGTGIAGEPLTLTATVTSATGVPTGNVTFTDGGVTIGTGTLNAKGIATFTTTTLSVATHTLVAIYAGDSNYSTSTSASMGQTIVLATATLVLAGPSAPVNAGTAVSLSAGMTTNGIAPTGTLSVREGSTALASQSVSSAGSFTFSLSNLSVGTHILTVVYSGDTTTATATSNTITVIIQQGSTTTALATSKNPQVLGQSITFSASVSSPSPSLTGSVSFYDGTTLLGSSSVAADGSASLTTSSLTFGLHSITAVYSGDTNHSASTSPAISQRIVQAAQIGLASSQNPAVAGASITFTVKLSGNASQPPTGSVTFLDGAQVLGTGVLDATGTATYTTTTLAVGSHSITATYPGDTSYSAVTSGVLTQTVTNSNTQVALTASANPATYASALTLRAAVTSNGGLATGNVTFTDGGTAIGTGVLDATATATLSISSLTPGSHSIVASYAGDGRASASVSVPLIVIVKQTAAVSLASSANPSSTLSAITFSAGVKTNGPTIATGSITFTDGGTQLGVITVDATGAASITVPQLTSGTHNITATYSGDGDTFAASSSVLTQTISLRPTTTALSATADPSNTQLLTLIAVERWTGPIAPTGTVTFTEGSTVLGSAQLDATGVATLVINIGTGTRTIVATYAGDANYSGSASPNTTIGGAGSPIFNISVNPSTVTLQSKQHQVVTLTLASPNNFADTLEFGCLGLPYAATCTFSTTAQKLAAGGTATVQLTIDTGDPLGAGASVSSNREGNSSNILVAFLPGTLLAGLMLFRFRKRNRGWAALALLLLAIGATSAMTGCGGLSVNGTPAGNYTFQVTARGQATGVSESQTITLNVTQ